MIQDIHSIDISAGPAPADFAAVTISQSTVAFAHIFNVALHVIPLYVPGLFDAGKEQPLSCDNRRGHLSQLELYYFLVFCL